jgi:hypothetical protein
MAALAPDLTVLADDGAFPLVTEIALDGVVVLTQNVLSPTGQAFTPSDAVGYSTTG